MSALHPIFAACCNPNPNRYDLAKPFVVGDHAYASDARIAVRTPVTPAIADEIGDQSGRKVPASIRHLFEQSAYLWLPELFPVPDISGVPKCEACEGRGAFPPLLPGPPRPLRIACDNCGDMVDAGVFVFGGDCPKCSGSGVEEDGQEHYFEVGNGFIASAGLLGLLSRHGVAGFRVPRKSSARKGDFLGARFMVGDSIEGILAGCYTATSTPAPARSPA